VGICGKSWKEQNKEEEKEERAFLFALREIKERRKCKIEVQLSQSELDWAGFETHGEPGTGLIS
jgi:hypothetical protein